MADTPVTSPTPARSALVIGSDTRAFLGVVRSLGRQGVAVDVAPFDFSSVALSSRYVRAVHRLPPLQLDPEAWITALLAVCEQTRPDFIVPCDDRSIIPLHEFASRVAHLRLAMPGELAFHTFFDKGHTRAMALQCGVPVPRGRVLAAGDTAAQLVAEFGLPLFVKPRNSYLLRALESRRNVSACHSESALQAVLDEIATPDEYLVEARFNGTGVGVSVLAKGGVISQAFQHRRVREPVGGGGSSYRQSEAVSPDLEAMTVALCAASRLEGVAMFEYKVDDATGQKALLEVNSRFWGSLPLAMAAGVDFPYLWFTQAMGEAPAPRVVYRVPCYARNLLNDLYATLGHIESRQREGVLVMAGEALRWVGSFGRLLIGIETLDTLQSDDPQPGKLELRAIAAKVGERITRVLPGARERRARQVAQTVQAAWATAKQQGRPVRVVVACYGNICRSPFAAVLLARAFSSTPGAAPGTQPVTVTGAALACRPSRPSPDRAVAAALRRGVDLAPHRSRYADDALLESADLVLVFDAANLGLLAARGLPLQREPLRLREVLADGSTGEIADPVDGDDAFFDRTYALIENAVAALQRTAEGPR
jgi:protein-tyrosine-phosphatase/predicted ATP-grasp superfamily ATP-dependent carboligase